MDEVSPGMMLVIILIALLVMYFVVRAATFSAVTKALRGDHKDYFKPRVGGLYLDNLGHINGGSGNLSSRSDSEKDRLRELKTFNEDLALSTKDPAWVLAELEKINHEVRGR